MTRSIAGRHRNGRLVAASAGVVAIFAAGALAGCGSGQIAETATIVSAVPGGTSSVAIPTKQNPNGALVIKNATVDYDNVNGYAPGDTAPLSVWIANQSTEVVTVTAGPAQLVSPTEATTPQFTSLGSMSLSSGSLEFQAAGSLPSLAPAGPSSASAPSAAPSESGSTPSGGTPSESASVAPAGSASVTIQPGMMAQLSSSVGPDVQHLQIAHLAKAVMPGNTVQLTFNVTSNGTPLQSTQVVAPVAPPTAPAPRVSDTGFPPAASPSS